MATRGVRGATSVEADDRAQVLAATKELLEVILDANPDMTTAEIASAIFTVSEDIDSAFPAEAARQAGWGQVPMFCIREIPVPGSLPLCIRVLIHWNTAKEQNAIRHVYLRQAVTLRPDLVMPEQASPR